jgi:hypothetical protein
VVEAADLFAYMASAAQVGLEWIDGQYVDTANRAAAADPSQPPPVRPSSAGGRGGGDGGGSTSPAPFVAGLREAGAAVQHGFAEATDAVVSAPLGQLETWQPGSAEVPPVVATMIRGVPVRARPPLRSLAAVAAALCLAVPVQSTTVPSPPRSSRLLGAWHSPVEAHFGGCRGACSQVAILRPMIGATEAVSAISVGVRKSFAD